MLEFSKTHPFPDNFWLLTSVTSAANYNRIEQLLEVRGGSVLGVSYEPAWGSVDLTEWLNFGQCGGGHRTRDRKLGWVISGGSSGATARPAHPDWFREVRDQCRSAGCAFFHKQNGEFAPWIDHQRSMDSPNRVYVWGNGKFAKLGDQVGPSGFRDAAILERVGKKSAGAIIDGREWREMPRAIFS